MLRNRALRDVLLMDRVCRTNRVNMEVATNDVETGHISAMVKVSLSHNLVGCNVYRLYVDKSLETESMRSGAHEPGDWIPDGADYETITINKAPSRPGLIVETDPYAGVQLPDRFQRIPETISLDRPAPQHNAPDEPTWSPYL